MSIAYRRRPTVLRTALIGGAWLAWTAVAAEPVRDDSASRPGLMMLAEVTGHAQPAQAAAVDRATASSIGEMFREFRRLYQAQRYDEARPLAEEILRRVEAFAPLADQVPTALNNLGAVQLESGDYAGADAAFSRALELLEHTQGVGSRRMISPLVGLGRARASQGQHARAAEVLQRALSISRRADGLFNQAQLEIMDLLVTSLIAIEDYESADQLRAYALQVVEHRYGVDDPRTLPVVSKLAEWYELTRRFVAARMLHLRIFRIASQTAEGRNATAIAALRGVARTHRLQFVLDPESVSTGPQTPGLIDREPRRWPELSVFEPSAPGQSFGPRLNSEGEQALRRALKIIEASPGVPAALRGAVHVDLGDWYMTARRPEEALRSYRAAWPLLPTSVLDVNQNPLLQPRLIVYRAPESALRRRDLPRDETVQRPVEFTFTVTARGEVREIVTVSSEANRNQEAAAREALQRAVYCPRFENGEPAETQGVRMREVFYDLAKEADDAAAGPTSEPAKPGTKTEARPEAAHEPTPEPARPAPPVATEATSAAAGEVPGNVDTAPMTGPAPGPAPEAPAELP